MIIAIDFDDTITLPGSYPKMGKLNPEAIEVIKELKLHHTLILWTCRVGRYLDEAINALKDVGIEFDYINDNPNYPSRKVLADIYIDDRAFGGVVDWKIIREQLIP